MQPMHDEPHYGDGSGRTIRSHMLSTAEKLIILRSVSLFGETPDNMLTELAGLLEEIVLEAGVTL